MRAAFSASGGQEVGTEEDSFFVVFCSEFLASTLELSADIALLERFQTPSARPWRQRSGTQSS
jgi:hypothetical protein